MPMTSCSEVYNHTSASCLSVPDTAQEQSGFYTSTRAIRENVTMHDEQLAAFARGTASCVVGQRAARTARCSEDGPIAGAYELK